MAPVHDVTGDGGLINLTGPVLIFGGPYSNVEATAAVLDEARRRGIPPGNIVCTGDLAAYCADPQAVINLVRESGIRLVMGNCEESLATEAAGCGCGFSAEARAQPSPANGTPMSTATSMLRAGFGWHLCRAASTLKSVAAASR